MLHLSLGYNGDHCFSLRNRRRENEEGDTWSSRPDPVPRCPLAGGRFGRKGRMYAITDGGTRVWEHFETAELGSSEGSRRNLWCRLLQCVRARGTHDRYIRALAERVGAPEPDRSVAQTGGVNHQSRAAGIRQPRRRSRARPSLRGRWSLLPSGGGRWPLLVHSPVRRRCLRGSSREAGNSTRVRARL